MGKGNGNNFNLAQIVVVFCGGNLTQIQFDKPTFRESRSEANKAVGMLSLIAMGGDSIGDSRAKDTEGWFLSVPDDAHITTIELAKVNTESGRSKQVSMRTYDCEHEGWLPS